jgi:predicted transcriptional regulator
MGRKTDDKKLKEFEEFKYSTLADIEYIYKKFEDGDCDPSVSETNALNNCLDEIEKVKDKIRTIYNKHLNQ